MISDRILPNHYRQLSSWIDTETQPLDAKLIIVPTQQIGYELTTAMASLSGGWLNLQALPTGEVAMRVLQAARHVSAPPLPAFLSSTGLPFLFEKILDDVKRESGVSLNRAAGAFAKTITDLRISRVTPQEYGVAASGPFTNTVLQVYDRYLKMMESLGVMDEAELYHRATEAIKDQGLFDSIVILEEVELSDVSVDFVRALGSRARSVFRIGQSALNTFTSTLSPLMAGRRLSEWKVPTTEPVVHPSDEMDGAVLDVLKAVDAENEIRTVFRSIVEFGLPLDSVEIASPVGDPYVRITRQLAERYHMPVTVATGIRAVDTRSGALVRAYLMWIIDKRPCQGLVRLLRSGLIRFRTESEVSITTVYEMASILSQMPVCGSLERYQSALDRIRKQTAAELKLVAGTFREKSVRADLILCDLIEKHVWPLIILPDMIDGHKSLDDMSAMISKLLYSYSAVSDRSEDSEGTKDPEFVARQELIARFEGLARQLSIRLNHSVLIARSLDVVTGAVVYARSARSGKLHLSPLSSAGYTGRPHLFVVGLDNQMSSSDLAEDPLFSDGEKDAALGDASGRLIQLARYRARTLTDQLSRVVARFDGKVSLIYSTYDLGANREIGASAALMSVSGLDDDIKKLIRTGSFTPGDGDGVHGRILDTTDMLLAAGLGSGRSGVTRGLARSEARSEARAEYPWMASGRHAEEQRSALDWTPFDGIMADNGKARNLFSGKSRLSASRLETLMACPYRYFLKHILRTYRSDEPEEDVWMDARTRGSIVHHVFHDFMIRATKENRSLQSENFDENLEVLRSLFEAAAEIYEQQAEVSNPADRAAVMSEFDYNSRAFLHDEARRSNKIKPKAFEYAFGTSAATKQSPDDPTDVFRLQLDGLEFNFQGRIDRIDELENGHFVITDYKTGSSKPYDSADLLSGGKSLQWALYAYAVEDLMGAPVDSSGYLFPNKREMGRRIESSPELVRKEIATLLRQAGLRVKAGHFIQSADPSGVCRFCDYNRVCGDTANRKRQLEEKIAATEPGDILYESLSTWAYAKKMLKS